MPQRILITRPIEQAKETLAKSQKSKTQFIVKPMVKIVPNNISKQTLSLAPKHDCMVFSSQNAVNIFVNMYLKYFQIQSLKHMNFAAIGEATKSKLKDFGLKANLMPKRYTTKNLAHLLINKLPAGSRIFYPCADKYNRSFANSLTKAGFKLTKCIVYKIQKIRYKKLDLNNIDTVIFSNSLGVESFFENIKKPDNNLNKIRFICIGPVTERKLRTYNYSCLKPNSITYKEALSFTLTKECS